MIGTIETKRNKAKNLRYRKASYLVAYGSNNIEVCHDKSLAGIERKLKEVN